MSERARRSVVLAALAGAGTVAAHSLAYAFAVPAAGRASVLANAGHGYWSFAVAGALTVGLLGGAVAIVRALQGGGVLPRIADLAVAQLLGFTAMEGVERFAAHQPVATMLDHHVILLGLALQPLVAFLFVTVVQLLCRIAVALIAPPLTRHKKTEVVRPPLIHPVVRRIALAGAAGVRGPPA